MQCKSGRTYVGQRKFKMDSLNFFSEKSFAQQNDTKKSRKQKRYFQWKNACFLKVLTTFYKEISEIINSIVMKER